MNTLKYFSALTVIVALNFSSYAAVPVPAEDAHGMEVALEKAPDAKAPAQQHQNFLIWIFGKAKTTCCHAIQELKTSTIPHAHAAIEENAKIFYEEIHKLPSELFGDAKTKIEALYHGIYNPQTINLFENNVASMAEHAAHFCVEAHKILVPVIQTIQDVNTLIQLIQKFQDLVH